MTLHFIVKTVDDNTGEPQLFVTHNGRHAAAWLLSEHTDPCRCEEHERFGPATMETLDFTCPQDVEIQADGRVTHFTMLDGVTIEECDTRLNEAVWF